MDRLLDLNVAKHDFAKRQKSPEDGLVTAWKGAWGEKRSKRASHTMVFAGAGHEHGVRTLVAAVQARMRDEAKEAVQKGLGRRSAKSLKAVDRDERGKGSETASLVCARGLFPPPPSRPGPSP